MVDKRDSSVIGIDLGTTFSAIAYLDQAGRPVTLANSEGEKLTPSALFFEDTNVIIGKEALKAISTDAEQVALYAKRDIGNRMFHKVLGGRQYPPEALEAWVLNKLRLDASQQIGAVENVVITVPAYFDEVRRKATQDAGYMAGLNVVDIINEPTAASLAYGYQLGLLDDEGVTTEKLCILVYDLGGGTFDVTVMEIEDRDCVTLATDGDVQLGGIDWDQRLVDYLAEEFIRKTGFDPREDPNCEGRLWRECEDAKRTLSARQKTSIACDVHGRSARIEVTRETFESITRDLLDRTAFTTRQTLQAAKRQWSDIDHVLLVGGSTRMPMIQQMLTELSGKEPSHAVSADEAVVHGAALRAGMIMADHRGEMPRFQIKNVNSHSLGVVATDSRTKRQRNAILIPRNTPLPATSRKIFRTQKDDQKSILVKIVEGESSSPDNCSPVGRCSVKNLPPGLPAQTEIEVSFHYRENGRLEVEVKVANTDCHLQHEITRENSLTQEQLDVWRQYITSPPASIHSEDALTPFDGFDQEEINMDNLEIDTDDDSPRWV